jgi:signal transduction histidine kinase
LRESFDDLRGVIDAYDGLMADVKSAGTLGDRVDAVAEVRKSADPDLPTMLGFEGELNQVILNMAVNAAHAIAEKGAGQGLITIRTAAMPGGVERSVTDTGTGIPEALRRRIFEPFFTTKGVGKGTGQGLAICQDIVVNKHGGAIDIETVPGEGTTFIMRFPDSTAEPGARQPEQAEAV